MLDAAAAAAVYLTLEFSVCWMLDAGCWMLDAAAAAAAAAAAHSFFYRQPYTI